MKIRHVAALLSGVTILTTLTVPLAAKAAPPKDKCSDPVMTKTFDHDQTGGWWAITLDMKCNSKFTKEYVVFIYNRKTRKAYHFETTPTRASSYHKVFTVASTPPSGKEVACVDAQASVFGPSEEPWDSKRLYDCFPITSPA